MSPAQRYSRVFQEIFGLPAEHFADGFHFADEAAWDSIAHMALITALEEEFGILFDTDEILGFESFENGKKILAKHGVACDQSKEAQ